MKNYFERYRILSSIVLLAACLHSCKKFVQIDPPVSSITSTTVYSTNTSASSVLTGMYINLILYSRMSSGTLSIGCDLGLASDELTSYDPTSTREVQFYKNSLTSHDSYGNSNYYFWSEIYNEIYVTNAALEGIAGSTGVTAPEKQQLNGEAKFMRAFLHFYSTNLYGAAPLVTTTNYQSNNTISRSPQAEIYQQIIADLTDAQTDLSAEYVDALGNSSTERIRPNQGAASALLARVYLYNSQWDSAAMEASKLINNSMYSLDTLNGVFLANSSESIWQLQPTHPGTDTWDAYFYVLRGAPNGGQGVALSPNLLGSFEEGDARYTAWVDSIIVGAITYYYPYKYKVWQENAPVTEYTTVLRLGEQYLIRAEAEANGAPGGASAAIADLNVIRNRAGLPNYSGNSDLTSLTTAILHERQVELFTEWGHRWFDLKRTNTLNSLLGTPGNVCSEKGGIWNPDWALLPLPLLDLQIDPNLTQNPGY